MSGAKAGSVSSSGIPASERRLVSSLKEIVSNSEEEIYAMLRECNRDPNETAQRLLSEGKFHVVKRRRDKKKENASNKELTDSSPRPSHLGSSNRSGKTSGTSDRGIGRGNSLARSDSNEVSGGLGRTSVRVDVPPWRKLSSTSASSPISQTMVQPEGKCTDTVSSQEPCSQHSNGDSLYPVPPVGLQGAWLAGSGHATMADKLKSKGACMINPSVFMSRNGTSIPAPVPDPQSPEISSLPSASLAASDSVVNPSLDPYLQNSEGVVKQKVGTIGNQQSFNAISSSCILEDKSSPSHSVQLPQSNCYSVVPGGNSIVETKVLQPGSPTSCLGGQLECFQNAGTFPGHSQGLVESSKLSPQSPSEAGLLGDKLSTISMYQSQQFIGTQKASTVVVQNSQPSVQNNVPALEMREPPSAGASSDRPLSCPPSPLVDIGTISATASKLQELNLRHHQPNIISRHLRVAEANTRVLSFGNFDSECSTFPLGFTTNTKNTSLSAHEGLVKNDTAVLGECIKLSPRSTSSRTLDQCQHLSSLEGLDRTGNSVVSNDMMAFISQSELAKRETSQQAPWYPYSNATSSLQGVDFRSPDHLGEYAIENASLPQGINPSSNVLQPNSDAATYYSGVFRQGPELDVHYSAFLSSAVTGKSTAGRPAAISQGARLEQSANAFVSSDSNMLCQTLQQQSLPINAYTAQTSALPMGSFANGFSYHYAPSGFSYSQSPYQHNYTGTGSYHQVPSVAAASVKYPLSQYKSGGTVVPGTAGYGLYSNSQSGTFAVNPPVTAGNASCFDDAASPYKDTNLYFPRQQVEGSSIWLQPQFAREMSGVQGSSFYNVSGQDQQTRCSQTQSSRAHSHPGAAFGDLYSPQNSGLDPNAHQLLQNSQVLGPVDALGTEMGSFQQAQRAQPHQSGQIVSRLHGWGSHTHGLS